MNNTSTEPSNDTSNAKPTLWVHPTPITSPPTGNFHLHPSREIDARDVYAEFSIGLAFFSTFPALGKLLSHLPGNNSIDLMDQAAGFKLDNIRGN